MSDDSSSEDSFPLNNKKRPRVITTSESSDDSDVPIRRPKLNRQRVVSQLNESSGEEESGDQNESGSSSSESDEDISLSSLRDRNSKETRKSPVKCPHSPGHQSDSSEGNSDKCPICLLSFSSQNIGTPENCEHLFCADCITEWSKNVNTCPVDRLTFNNILVRRKAGGKVIKTVPVSPRRPSEEEYFIEDTTFCEICHQSNSEETMLLCDSCDLGYHMHCLTPPLTEVPETEWFCPRCIRRNIHGNTEDDNQYIHAFNLRDADIDFELVSEIFNATAQTLSRINRMTREPAPSTSGSTSYRSSHRERNRTSNNTITTRRRRRRRRATTRTVVVEYETKDDGKFPIRVTKKKIKRRKKRRVRRAPRTAARRALVRSSVRGRLAEQCRLPITEVSSGIGSLAVPKLNVFGNANELEYFEDSDNDYGEMGGGGEGAVVAVTSRSIASAILDSHRQVRRKRVFIPSPTYASTAPDILSSIMESQTLLHSKKSHQTTSVKSSTNSKTSLPEDILNNKRLDLQKEDINSNVKEAPGYPGGGGGRRSGGWGGQGGYQSQGQDNRGSYGGNDYQGNRGQDHSYQGNRSFNSSWQGGNSAGGIDNFQRREQFDYMERSPMQRNQSNFNRGRGGQLRFNQPPPQRSPWQSQHNTNEQPSPFSAPPPTSFPMEGQGNTGDMIGSQDNMGFNLRQANYSDMNVYQSPQTIPPAISHTTPLPPPPQPPIIRFQRPPLSEDERSDTSVHDEPDKYDPMEPTLDDSGSEDDHAPRPINIVHNKITIVSPPRKDHSLVAEYESESESLSRDALNTNNVISVPIIEPQEPEIVGDDCPNFSIYSSARDIIKSRPFDTEEDVERSLEEKEEDLVQEDDDHYDESHKEEEIDNIESIPIPPEKPDEPELDNDWGMETNQQEEEKCQEEDKMASVTHQEHNIFDDHSEVEKNQDNKGVSGSDDEIIKENTDAKIDVENKADSSIIVGNIKTSPQKRTPITIKLLPNRPINKNVSLYDKEDCVNLDTSTIEDKEAETDDDSLSPNKTKSDLDNNKLDDEVKKLNTSNDFCDNIEKLTECISDVEDERSYTPCLDEKTKDNSFENEKDNLGIEGLDTEMISEDEGNDIFSDHNNQKTDSDGGALELSVRETELQPEEGEIVEKHKQKVKERMKAFLKQPNRDAASDEDRKKKKRDKKPDKEMKEKAKTKGKKGNDDSGFKKLSKSNKERNYRDREEKSKPRGKEKRVSKSPDVGKENKIDKEVKAKDKKKEKRKDIERYDVRNIISDKGRRVKDAFGRDTSRPRSISHDSCVGTPPRFRRSLSRRRSGSPGRRSPSRGRRSISRGRRSISRPRRSISRGRRSNSRGKPPLIRGRRSLSRKRSGSRGRSPARFRKSISPHRSTSPKFRRSVSPRVRKIRSPRRRSMSKNRSPIRRRSISPFRSKSPKMRRSTSRGKNKRGKRSVSRGKRLSPRPRRDSPPRRRLSRRSRSRLRSLSKNRSASPKARKVRKIKRQGSNSSKRKKSKSPNRLKQKRRRSKSFSPGVVLSRSPSPVRNNVQEPWTREKSPLYREWSSGSPSMSPARRSQGWTPPPQRHKSPQPDNLRVILTTKDKKKKERKKKVNKRLKANERLLQQQKELGSCKEVFTSGNNILVSVSFNKNQENQAPPEISIPNGVPKKKKHKENTTTKSKKDKNKERTKKRRGDKNKKSKDDENKKPVAIIDLDKSPFKEITPSPKAVIILSDSENGEKEEELMERQEMIRGELMEMGFPQMDDAVSPRRSPARENVYVPTAGPKTPPEPAVKFTIANKANPQLRAVNPLHEDEEEITEQVTEDKQEPDKRTGEAHKGPNTPPEPPNSPPSSPDAYDPFEPTRSASATPERPSTPQTEKRTEDLLQVPTMSLEAAQKSNLSADDVIQARPISPMEKVLALLKSTRNNLSPANPVQPLYSEQIFDTTRNVEIEIQPASQAPPSVTVQSPEKLSVAPTITKSQVVSALVKPNSPKLIYSSVAPTVVTSTAGFLNPTLPRIPVYNTGTSPNPRIILPSPTKSSPLKIPTNKLFVGKPSPIKSTPIKPMPSKTIISKLPMPAIKPLPRSMKDKNKNGQNGNDIIDLDLDMDSPYSPGSSDFGDLFDPPADNGKHNTNAYAPNKNANNAFDSLFPVKPSKSSNKSHTKVTVKQTKKSKGTKVGVRMDEDNLRILDDLPSSAVELQVKTKFLKKLNRQERVVEEVKLVLKPHYSKKHITKDDYKEILRRAVPKICHNRSGEINPAKIHALIEAYVRKFRKKALVVK